MSTIKFDAIKRDELGTSASRRLRHQGYLPVIVYGQDKAPVSLALDHNKFLDAVLDKTVFEADLVLVIDGQEEKVKLQDLQRHPFKRKLTHVDFLRI